MRAAAAAEVWRHGSLAKKAKAAGKFQAQTSDMQQRRRCGLKSKAVKSLESEGSIQQSRLVGKVAKWLERSMLAHNIVGPTFLRNDGMIIYLVSKHCGNEKIFQCNAVTM